MLRVVLVDDEKPSLDELEYLLSGCSSCNIIKKFTNPVDALEYIKMEEPDLVFLDINMPVLDGLSLAEEMLKLNLRTSIVFASAYDHYALSAFDMNAIDYVLKPYDKDRIFKAIRKIRNKLDSPSEKRSYSESMIPKAQKVNKIPIWKGDKIILIKIDDILYCQVIDGELVLHTKLDCYVMNDTLTNLESKLPRETFFKTHRSYIVNLLKVSEVSSYFNNTLIIKLDGSDAEIPVSRSNVKEFKEMLKI
jgi:DNA-binding LytR/AlgR family response regulator